MAKLILYVHKEAGKSGLRFIEVMQQQFGDVRLEVCESLECFERTFDRPVLTDCGKRILVLFIDNEHRLVQLSDHATLLAHERVIALLPEQTKTFVTRVNRFYPRYTGLISESYSDIKSVLKKMIEQ
jgi:hypothetical protein